MKVTAMAKFTMYIWLMRQHVAKDWFFLTKWLKRRADLQFSYDTFMNDTTLGWKLTMTKIPGSDHWPSIQLWMCGWEMAYHLQFCCFCAQNNNMLLAIGLVSLSGLVVIWGGYLAFVSRLRSWKAPQYWTIFAFVVLLN